MKKYREYMDECEKAYLLDLYDKYWTDGLSKMSSVSEIPLSRLKAKLERHSIAYVHRRMSIEKGND